MDHYQHLKQRVAALEHYKQQQSHQHTPKPPPPPPKPRPKKRTVLVSDSAASRARVVVLDPRQFPHGHHCYTSILKETQTQTGEDEILESSCCLAQFDVPAFVDKTSKQPSDESSESSRSLRDKLLLLRKHTSPTLPPVDLELINRIAQRNRFRCETTALDHDETAAVLCEANEQFARLSRHLSFAAQENHGAHIREAAHICAGVDTPIATKHTDDGAMFGLGHDDSGRARWHAMHNRPADSHRKRCQAHALQTVGDAIVRDLLHGGCEAMFKQNVVAPEFRPLSSLPTC